MKIDSSTALQFMREPAKPAATRAHPAAPAEAMAKPAKAAADGAQKVSPPGLERALSRLQSISETDRTTGQSNAIDKISRNIARYTEIETLDTTSSRPPGPSVTATPPARLRLRCDARNTVLYDACRASVRQRLLTQSGCSRSAVRSTIRATESAGTLNVKGEHNDFSKGGRSAEHFRSARHGQAAAAQVAVRVCRPRHRG